jgi:GT2 family glycosyltransferase
LPDGIINEITGWSLATTVELWDKLGGLRIEGKYAHMWSDTEFCIRAQLLGYKLCRQGYNNKMIHFSGLSHSAIHNKENYDKRVLLIRDKLKYYEQNTAIN